jgi:SAM-dependent methyltransferase
MNQNTSPSPPAPTNDIDLEQATIDTYTTYAEDWAAGHAQLSEWRWAAQHLRELAPSKATLLEIGCGGARDAKELIQLGFDYTGTDASIGMIRAAHRNVPSGKFEQINVYNLLDLHQQFDTFWACAILLHIPKQRIDEALQSIHNVLRDHGLGFITIKDGTTEEFEVRDKHGRHEARLFAYWEKDAFITALHRNGFEVVEYAYKPMSERTKWHIFFVRKIA